MDLYSTAPFSESVKATPFTVREYVMTLSWEAFAKYLTIINTAFLFVGSVQCEGVKAVVIRPCFDDEALFTGLVVHLHRVIQPSISKTRYEQLCHIAVLAHHAVFKLEIPCGLINTHACCQRENIIYVLKHIVVWVTRPCV